MMNRASTGRGGGAVCPSAAAFSALAVLAVSAVAAPPGEQQREPVTGILGAMGSETAPIAKELADRQTRRLLGVTFICGRLRGRRVVLAKTGVGKVNAAMVTTLLLDHFRPAEVVFTGIAGGVNPQLQPCDVVIGRKLVQHDLGNYTANGLKARGVRSPVDGSRNPVFLESAKRLVEAAGQVAKGVSFDPIKTPEGQRRPQVTTGVIATGDVFVASGQKRASLRKRLGADAVEMEGAAVAQICHQQRLPFLVIRGLSDKADENVHRDIRRFMQIAAGNAAKLTAAVVGRLARRAGGAEAGGEGAGAKVRGER